MRTSRALLSAGIALAGLTVSGCSLLMEVDISRATSGWSPEPTAPAPELAAFARDVCLDDPAFVPDTEIQDQRGPDAAAFLWLRAEDEAGCFVHRDQDGVLHATGITETDWGRRYESLADTADRSHRGPTIASGPTGPGATGVELVLPDGMVITATVASGMFLAWWPRVEDWMILRSLGPDGAVIDQIGPWEGPDEIVAPG